MSLFNSLGSNYAFATAVDALTATNSDSHAIRLQTYLQERYGGEVTLLYKGREGIRLALETVGKKGKAVAICGFTCFAVYDSIVIEGYKPVYLDIDTSLQFSPETLKKALKEHPDIIGVIIQNTLGYPCEIGKIAKLCKEKDIVLIEDLAHSIGATYVDGKEAGTVGDFVILSFSQDKVVDGASGGSLIVRSVKYKAQSLQRKQISAKQQQIDRLYPLLTFFIRKTYAFGIGKVLHALFKKTNLLSKPMEGEGDTLHALPNWQAYLIYQGYKELDEQLVHRRKIATIYKETLDTAVLEKVICDTLELSVNLRFPIFVKDREDLITYVKKRGIYISDIWYDAPIGPKTYVAKTDYDGQCPNSEKIAEQIVNLPTHRNMSEKDAKFIAENVNEWLR